MSPGWAWCPARTAWICVRMLAEAPEYLSEQGLLIVEVGASEPALSQALPEVPFVWIEFESGPMGVFAHRAPDLVAHAAVIARAAQARRRPPAAARRPGERLEPELAMRCTRYHRPALGPMLAAGPAPSARCGLHAATVSCRIPVSEQ